MTRLTMRPRKECTRDDCTGTVAARGLCRRHYQAAWAANDLPPIVKQGRTDAFECPADHKHDAMTTCYKVHRCRCVKCCERASSESATRNRLQAMGRWEDPFVSTIPARAHLLTLRHFNIGRRQVAELTGISESSIQAIVRGETDKCLKTSADLILAIEATGAKAAPHALVPARATHRRIQALAAIGWSMGEQASRLGLHSNNVSTWLAQDSVTQEKADAVADLYEQLWDQRPSYDSAYKIAGVGRIVKLARRRGWVVPLAWDDIDTDDAPPPVDVEVDVDEMAVELAMLGERVRLRPAERRVAVSRLHARRYSDQKTAALLGCDERTVLRIRQELGLEAFDFADLQQERAS